MIVWFLKKKIETKLLIYLLFSNNHFRLNDIIGGATELIYDIIFEYVDWFVLCMTLYTWCRPDKIWHMDEGTCTATENVLVVFSLSFSFSFYFFFIFFYFFFVWFFLIIWSLGRKNVNLWYFCWKKKKY